MKRVLILTADIGFGHTSAANAIRAALVERYGRDCTVDVVDPLKSRTSPRLLRRKAGYYDHLVRSWPRLYGLAFDVTNRSWTNSLVNHAYASLLRASLAALVRELSPDLVVTTYPYYQAPLAAVCASPRPWLPWMTVVTDFVTIHRCWFHPDAHACCVPTDYAAQSAMSSGLSLGKVHLTGIPVHTGFAAPAPPAAELRRQLGWRAGLPTLLVVGSRRVEQVQDYLAAIDRARLPLQLVIVCGGDQALFRSLSQQKWNMPTHLYAITSDVPRMMAAADWVMSKAGGLITAEALACGRPLLLTGAIPGQEEGNVDFVVRHGAGAKIDTAGELVATLRRWCDDRSEPQQMATSAARLGRPQAAYAVADLGWKLMRRFVVASSFASLGLEQPPA